MNPLLLILLVTGVLVLVAILAYIVSLVIAILTPIGFFLAVLGGAALLWLFSHNR